MKINQLKQDLDDEIERIKRIKKWLEGFANVLEDPIVERVSSSYGLGTVQIFIDAGKQPKVLARRFKASYEKHGDTWVGKFPDFQLTFMDAEETETFIL